MRMIVGLHFMLQLTQLLLELLHLFFQCLDTLIRIRVLVSGLIVGHKVLHGLEC